MLCNISDMGPAAVTGHVASEMLCETHAVRSRLATACGLFLLLRVVLGANLQEGGESRMGPVCMGGSMIRL